MHRFPLSPLGVCTTCVVLLVGCDSPVAPHQAAPPPPPAPSLSFEITGPSRIDAEGSFNWNAFAFGGSGQYQYGWEVTRQAGKPLTRTSIGPRLSLLVTTGDGDLLVSLSVSSGNESRVRSFRVRNCVAGCTEIP